MTAVAAGTVTITGTYEGRSGSSPTITVTLPCTYELSHDYFGGAGSGWSYTFSVTASGGTGGDGNSCSWEPVVSEYGIIDQTHLTVDWITVDDPGVRYGSGTVTYTVERTYSNLSNIGGVRRGAIIVAEPAECATGSPYNCYRIYQTGFGS